MKTAWRIESKRLLWYLTGLVLFFAPFAYYEKAVSRLLGTPIAESFHYACLRMPLLNLLSGKGLEIASVGFVSLLLLLGSAILIGPFFCSRLCVVGALPEYLSRIIPSRLQINWQRSVPPVPIRYGFLVGFIAAPFISGSIACSFCNYSIFERMSTAITTGGLGVLGSTTILTAVLWLLLFGAFARGGRGFCTYLCPVGAAQSLVHWLGAKLSFTQKLCFSPDRCISCGLCAKKCPTGTLQAEQGQQPAYLLHTCLTCRSCVELCPQKALQFTTGASSWNKDFSEIPVAVALSKKV